MMRQILALCVALLAPAVWAQESVLPEDLGARVEAGYVAPAVDGFVVATSALRADISGLCDEPSDDNLAQARNGFAKIIDAWGPLSVLRFGPLVADNRFEAIFFWPDTRGTTLKQVQAALAAGDTMVTDPDLLTQNSVALQSLFALDYLLAGTDAETLETGNSHRCAFALAVTDVMVDHAYAIAAGWAPEAPIGSSFREPSGDGYFRNQQEVAGELVKSILTVVDYVRAAELGPPLGESIEEARGRRAPLWRSDLTFRLVAAQLAGAVDLLDATGLAETLTDTRATPFTNLHTDLVQVSKTIAGIEQPVEQAFADPTERRKLEYAMLLLGYASTNISGPLTEAMGLSMGFNALDGD